MKKFQNNDSDYPPAAIRRVSKLRSPEAIRALTVSLKDRNTLSRAAAYKRLIDIGKPVIPALLSSLETPTVDCYTQDIFRVQNSPAARSLVQALKNGSLKLNSKSILLRMDQEAILPLIQELGNSALEEEISDIFSSLEIRGNAVVRPLIKAVSSKRLRPGAVHALTDLILNDVLGEQDYSLLVQILSEWSTRRVFARHFMNVRILIPAFIELSGTVPAEQKTHARLVAQKTATSVLTNIGQPAVSFLITSLTSSQTRVTSAKILTRIGSPAVPELIGFINRESDSDILSLAVKILGDIRDKAATAPLVDLLKRGSDAKVRTECANSLGKIADPSTLRDLMVAMETQEIETDVARVIVRTRPIYKAFRSFNKKHKEFYCIQCLHRVIAKKIYINKNDFIYSYICRRCHSVSHVVDGVGHVVLVLDSNLPLKPPEDNLLFFKEIDQQVHKMAVHISWLWYKEPFDFDEVQLKNNNEFEIEEFIMKMRNDTDSKRRKKFHSIPVFIYPDLTLTTAQLNALKDTFKKIRPASK